MLSVGCCGVATVSNVAAVNSFPDLEFSYPRAGPWHGPFCSSRRQVLPSELVIL